LLIIVYFPHDEPSSFAPRLRRDRAFSFPLRVLAVIALSLIGILLGQHAAFAPSPEQPKSSVSRPAFFLILFPEEAGSPSRFSFYAGDTWFRHPSEDEGSFSFFSPQDSSTEVSSFYDTNPPSLPAPPSRWMRTWGKRLCSVLRAPFPLSFFRFSFRAATYYYFKKPRVSWLFGAELDKLVSLSSLSPSPTIQTT